MGIAAALMASMRRLASAEVRDVFSGFRFADVGLTYTLHGGEGSKVGEVIILDNKDPAPQNLPRG